MTASVTGLVSADWQCSLLGSKTRAVICTGDMWSAAGKPFGLARDSEVFPKPSETTGGVNGVERPKSLWMENFRNGVAGVSQTLVVPGVEGVDTELVGDSMRGVI